MAITAREFEVVMSLQPRLEAYAGRISHDPDIAEEAPNMALADVIRRTDLTQIQDPVSYVFGAVRHKTLTAMRKKLSQPRSISLNHRIGEGNTELGDLLPHTGPGPDEEAVSEVIRMEDHQRIRRALGTLTSPQREAVIRTVVEGLSQAELSRQIGVSITTVRNRRRDGLIKLRETLDPESCPKKIFDLPGKRGFTTALRRDLLDRFGQPGESFLDMVKRVIDQEGTFTKSAAYLGVSHNTFYRFVNNRQTKEAIGIRYVTTLSGKEIKETQIMKQISERYGRKEPITDILTKTMRQTPSKSEAARRLGVGRKSLAVTLIKLGLS